MYFLAHSVRFVLWLKGGLFGTVLTSNHPQNILRLFQFTVPFPPISMLKRKNILITADSDSKTLSMLLAVEI